MPKKSRKKPHRRQGPQKGRSRPPLDRVATTSPDLLHDKKARLAEIFPEALSEGKVDVSKLRTALGEDVDDRPERYSFTWAGKRDAIRLLQIPSRATLVPDPKESLDFGGTQNVFIEGENLEVLKLLYKAYAGRVKMIYIDPPYNTGNDFIYPDNFTDPLDTYLKLTGQKSAEGNLLTSNPESSGRYHSAWLSMMYPRLFLARQLLRDDGVIFVSIDDHEGFNLRLLMNEVFGEDNFIAELVWEKTRKNDAKLFSVGHEYMLAYARSLPTLKAQKTIWREAKPGAAEILAEYERLRVKHGADNGAIEIELKDWYQRLPDAHPAKRLARYKHVDQWGPWRDRDISWPGGGGPRYHVLHPVTKRPCAVPERGWGFSTSEAMQRQILLGLVVFREDHTKPPIRKAHLVPVPEELDDDSPLETNGEDDQEQQVGMQVMPSVIYKQAQGAVKYLRGLMGAKVFDNPKDHEVLARLIRYCTGSATHDLVLDCFGGSGSTAEAVLRLNNEDGGNRNFIVVQLPEPTPESSVARSKGFSTIADIAKERMRRVVKRINEEKDGKLDLRGQGLRQDLGFRTFNLAESHYRRWSGIEEHDAEALASEMELFAKDPLIPGWKPEPVIWEVAIKEGYGLTSRIEKLGKLESNTVYRVTDAEREQSFLICLDDTVSARTAKALQLAKDDLFICRDAALTDDLAANLALQCRLKTI